MKFFPSIFIFLAASLTSIVVSAGDHPSEFEWDSKKELDDLHKYATDVYPNEQTQQLESKIQDVYDPAKLYTKDAIIK